MVPRKCAAPCWVHCEGRKRELHHIPCLYFKTMEKGKVCCFIIQHFFPPCGNIQQSFQEFFFSFLKKQQHFFLRKIPIYIVKPFIMQNTQVLPIATKHIPEFLLTLIGVKQN